MIIVDYCFYPQESNEEVQVVQAFLLNDSLMVASHIRRRKGPVRYKFQALYELDNMAVVEVKDSEALRNAFKILMFPDSHLYQVVSLQLLCVATAIHCTFHAAFALNIN